MQASAVTGLNVHELTELVSLRKRLLHDLPAMRQRVSDAMAQQQRGNRLHVTHLRGGCGAIMLVGTSAVQSC